jgi:hypothetical protein
VAVVGGRCEGGGGINHPITIHLSHQVKAVDKTDLMVEVMYRELADFHKIKDEFVKEFSQEDFDWIVKVCFFIVSFNPFIYITLPTKPLMLLAGSGVTLLTCKILYLVITRLIMTLRHQLCFNSSGSYLTWTGKGGTGFHMTLTKLNINFILGHYSPVDSLVKYVI